MASPCSCSFFVLLDAGASSCILPGLLCYWFPGSLSMIKLCFPEPLLCLLLVSFNFSLKKNQSVLAYCLTTSWETDRYSNTFNEPDRGYIWFEIQQEFRSLDWHKCFRALGWPHNVKTIYNHCHSPIKRGYKSETGFLGEDLAGHLWLFVLKQ